MGNNQQGFTLIELVMVIVILGVLAATALPKFASLQGDARAASIKAGAGAMSAAMQIVHAQSIIEGEETASAAAVTLEGVSIVTKYGYPTDASIFDAANISADDYVRIFRGRIVLNNQALKCMALYEEATSASSAPTMTIDVSQC